MENIRYLVREYIPIKNFAEQFGISVEELSELLGSELIVLTHSHDGIVFIDTGALSYLRKIDDKRWVKYVKVTE